MQNVRNLTRNTTNLLFQRIINTKKIIDCKNQQPTQDRNIWGYVAIAFNKVDTDRLRKVGPNRLCAEWVLKNGGAVRIKELPTRILRDYNFLPPEDWKFHIKEVDASNASIMKIGLDHFIGCEFIDTVILHNCKHLEDDGLDGLLHLKNSLKRLQISGSYNIQDEGLKVVLELTNLEKFTIFDMVYVKHLDDFLQKLRQRLPNCDIQKIKN